MKNRLKPMLIVVCFILGACGALDTGPGTGDPAAEAYSGPILIWNLSQFELLEIYTHPGSGLDVWSTDNQFTEPLAPDATAVICWNFNNKVSVVREKTQGGLLLGLTTQQAPGFTQAQSVLIVFDDGFRALVDDTEAEATPGFPGFPDEIISHAAECDPTGD